MPRKAVDLVDIILNGLSFNLHSKFAKFAFFILVGKHGISIELVKIQWPYTELWFLLVTQLYMHPLHHRMAPVKQCHIDVL